MVDKLNIAYCISGQLREGYGDFYHTHFAEFKKKHNVDVFASFWNTNNLENFARLFDPLYIELEDFNIWHESLLSLFQEIKLPEPYNLWDHRGAAEKGNFYPMWYKIWRANLLTKKSNKKYDIIIRARSDANYSDFDVEKFDGLVIPKGHVVWMDEPQLIGINDVFAYGPPKHMDYYCSLYHYLRSYINEGVPIIPAEGLLTYHLRKRPIVLKRTNTLIYANSSKIPYNNIIDTDPPVLQRSDDLIFDLTNFNKKFIV